MGNAVKGITNTVGNLLGQGGSGEQGQQNVANSLYGIAQTNIGPAIQQALAQQQAGIQSQYAAAGDAGSSAELQDLNAAKVNSILTQFQLEEGAYGAAGQAYSGLASTQLAQNQALMKTITGFGQATGLLAAPTKGSGGVTL